MSKETKDIPQDFKIWYIAESRKQPQSETFKEWKRLGQQLCYEVAHTEGYQEGAEAAYCHLSQSSKPEGGLGWVRVSEHLPLHKAHWNTGKFGDHDNDFPVRMNGRYSMANIFDQATPNSPNTMFMLSFDGRDHYEDEFSEIEWLDESIHSSEPAKGSHAVNHAIEFTEWINSEGWSISTAALDGHPVWTRTSEDQTHEEGFVLSDLYQSFLKHKK